MKILQCRGTQSDHHRPHHHCPVNTPIQDPVLIFQRDAKVFEEEEEDEEVVDAETLFDEVAGEEFFRDFGTDKDTEASPKGGGEAHP
mmetsp:Transcript_1840/g.3568  ORF Transcript_1840/g.3568 Transcript_1840/m.3568 type:complete len:87 (-) Transcript_1840:356-616(-)